MSYRLNKQFDEKKNHSTLFTEVILKSWWVILFFLFSYFAFDQAFKRKTIEEDALKKKLATLLEDELAAEQKQEDLKLEIASQNDPMWIELTLKRCLGLVPEGEIKVHFPE